MFWIPEEEITQKRVIEKDCIKVPKIKSYMASASNEKVGILVRDKSCYCKNCMEGEMCTSSTNGKWVERIVQKSAYEKNDYNDNDEDDDEENDDESDNEEEFDYKSEGEDDSGDDDGFENAMEEIQNVSGSWEGYVLYKYLEKKFFVGTVIEQSCSEVSVKLARKYYGDNSSFTFTWHEINDKIVVDVTNEDSAQPKDGKKKDFI